MNGIINGKQAKWRGAVILQPWREGNRDKEGPTHNVRGGEDADACLAASFSSLSRRATKLRERSRCTRLELGRVRGVKAMNILGFDERQAAQHVLMDDGTGRGEKVSVLIGSRDYL